MPNKFPEVVVPERVLLVHSGAVVGFRKQIACVSTFSRDGVTWSSVPIESEEEWPASPLLSRTGEPTYSGQIVQLSPSYPLQIVCVWNEQTLFLDPHTHKLTPAARLLKRLEVDPHDLKKDGDMYASAPDKARYQEIMARHKLFPTPPAAEVLSLFLFWLAGVTLLLALQWRLWQSVGPLLTTSGGILGVTFFFWWKQRTRIGWLRRPYLVTLCFRHALSTGVFSTIAYGFLLFASKGLAGARGRPLLSMLLVGVAVFLVNLISGLVVGDSVAWWTQRGYCGEREESFRAS